MKYYLLSQQQATECGIDLRWHQRTADGRVIVTDREMEASGIEINMTPVDCRTVLKQIK